MLTEVWCAKLGMRCSIGVTTGDAYCGSVGNESRCEYAIVGDCVNLSARLMANANGRILCDADTEYNVSYNADKTQDIRFEPMGKVRCRSFRMVLLTLLSCR